MDKSQLIQVVKEEVYSACVLIEESKETIIQQIDSVIKKKDRRNCWFELKMILFQNRYSTIDRDKFFSWLETTHLRELADSLS